MFASISSAPELDRRSRSTDQRRTAFVLVLTAFLLYAALFIYRTSFVIGGERYFSLFDDAMVSMRYAKNFANGDGLVWNPGGPHVEGYTNLLWVLYMGAVHLLPIPASKTSLVIQITAAVLLTLNLVYVRRLALALSSGSSAVAIGAVALTASYLPLNYWSLQGMEVSVLVLLTSACTWKAIQSLESGSVPRTLYVLLGIGTWVRPDVAVMFLAFLGFMLFVDRMRWRHHLAWGVAAFVVSYAVQTAFREWYYGNVLPNTYYLKLAGIPLLVRLARGAEVLLQFVWNANVLLFALPFALLLKGDVRIALVLWLLVAQMTYSVYVGGDAWEYWGGSNRYICPVMPGFFVLLAYALHELAAATVKSMRGAQSWFTSEPRVAAWISALAIVAAAVNLNSVHGIAALAEALLIRPPLHTGPGEANQLDVEQALAIRHATTRDASVAVIRAGTVPYFLERACVDLLGKSDSHVAHEPPRLGASLADFREFRPGHVKFDFAYSIAGLEPDVILHLRRREGLASPFLKNYEGARLGNARIYLRRGSAHVLVDRLPAVRDQEGSGISRSSSANGLLQGVSSGS
jgi:hypothetical protein